MKSYSTSVLIVDLVYWDEVKPSSGEDADAEPAHHDEDVVR